MRLRSAKLPHINLCSPPAIFWLSLRDPDQKDKYSCLHLLHSAFENFKSSQHGTPSSLGNSDSIRISICEELHFLHWNSVAGQTSGKGQPSDTSGRLDWSQRYCNLNGYTNVCVGPFDNGSIGLKERGYYGNWSPKDGYQNIGGSIKGPPVAVRLGNNP